MEISEMTESGILKVNLLDNLGNLTIVESDDEIELILKALSSKFGILLEKIQYFIVYIPPIS